LTEPHTNSTGIKRFFKRIIYILTRDIIVLYMFSTAVLIVSEILIFSLIVARANVSYHNLSRLPIDIIQFGNALLAFIISLKTMNIFEVGESHRRIWRFVMLGVFFLTLGHFVSILNQYIFKITLLRPPGIQDWLGYLWVLPMLFIAISREYNLVKTKSMPNKFMRIGLIAAIALYAVVLVVISPVVTTDVTVAERLVSLWNIGFSFACVTISISLLSEIYSGLLSTSWKIIITAVCVMAANYVLIYLVGRTTSSSFIDVLSLTTSQIGPLLIALAASVERSIVR